MKIGIDARLLERRMTGIGRYLSGIVKNIGELDPSNEYVLFTYRPIRAFSAKNIRNVATSRTAATEGVLAKLRSVLWLHMVLPKYLRQEKIEIFFSPNTLLPWFGTGAKNAITIHDVFQLIDSKFHSSVFRAYVSVFLKRTLKKTDLILTVSESSKRDIVKLLHVPSEKIRVTYEGADDRFAPRDLSEEEKARLRSKYGLSQDFILYVGVIEERKNIACLLKIADALREKEAVDIVLVGRAGYRGDEYLRKVKKRNNMKYIGFVDEEDLPLLYNLATMFVFPSYYEGFGLPPLEAMQSGVPVVASNASSLPEIVDGAGILLAPGDNDGFVRVVRDLLHDPEKRVGIIARGLARTRIFKTQTMARDTIRSLHDLVV